MPEQLWFTALLNKYLAGVVTPLLNALPESFHPQHPQAPISNFVAMELLVFGLLLAVFILVRSRLSVESPGGLQHLAEGVEEFIEDQSREIIGHDNKRFTPFLVTLGLFILFGNLLGLIPGFESPTGNPSVPLGCAVLAFLYYHMHGIRKQGVLKYLKHFMGPLPLLAPLLFVIEIISHSARLMSLTIRLYANMFAGDLITLLAFSIVPLLLPVGLLAFHIFVGFLQTYIFVLLTAIYLGGAVAEEH